jgi:ABC-type bacteriocin/lantibiotic exporter with double-glycine peptidase domain
MNIKALAAAILTVFVGIPLAVMLFGFIVHFVWPLAVLGVIGSIVYIVYRLFCLHFEQQ